MGNPAINSGNRGPCAGKKHFAVFYQTNKESRNMPPFLYCSNEFRSKNTKFNCYPYD